VSRECVLERRLDGRVGRVLAPLRGANTRLQADQAVSQGSEDAEDSVGLQQHREQHFRRLEEDQVARDQRRRHGRRVQEVRQGDALAGQGDEGVGRFWRRRGRRQEHDDFAAGRHRAAESGDSRAPLAGAHEGHRCRLFDE